MPDSQRESSIGDGAVKPELTGEEVRQVEERSALRVNVVHEAIRREGEDELARPASALAWSGFAAGLSMGFSLVAEGLLYAHLPDTPWRQLLVKLGYSLGFLVVILGRQQLFTENTLTGIIPLLTHRNRGVFFNVCRLWTVVFLSNLAGALVFGWVAGNTNAFDRDVLTAFTAIGRDAIGLPFGATVLRGVFAGWLIALMVWMMPVAHSSRVAIVIIITYFVALGRFPHIIAGSVEVFYLVCIGQMPPADYLGAYMLPTLIGNVLGGVSLVSALNHAQTVAGMPRPRPE